MKQKNKQHKTIGILAGTLLALLVIFGTATSVFAEPANATQVPGMPAASVRGNGNMGVNGEKNNDQGNNGDIAIQKPVGGAGPAVTTSGMAVLTKDDIAKLRTGTQAACVEVLKTKFPNADTTAIQNRCMVIISGKGPFPTVANRVVTKDDRDRLQAKIDADKTAFYDLRAKYQKDQFAFQNAVKAEKACTTSTTAAATTTCASAQQTSIDAGKKELSDLSDMIVASLDGLKSRIQESSTMTDQAVNDQVATIDARIKEVEDAKAKSQSATTKEDVKAQAVILTNLWHTAETSMSYSSTGLLNANIKAVITQSDAVKTRLDMILAQLQKNGKDTTKIQPLVDQFNSDITAAKDDVTKAEDMLANPTATTTAAGNGNAATSTAGTAATTSASMQNVKAAQALLKDARDNLTKANQTLRQIITMINAQGGMRNPVGTAKPPMPVGPEPTQPVTSLTN